MRVLATGLALLFLTAIGLAPAQAAPRSAVVVPQTATLLADGSVEITMKVRCNAEQLAFEWSVEIRQGANYGNDYAGAAAGVIPCDGKFHTVHANVPGANGPYAPGPANVQALVQLYDTVEDSDVQLEDREVVRLKR